MAWLQPYKDGVAVIVKVTPRACKTRCLGAESEWLRLALQAPPVDGKANSSTIDWLAQQTGIPQRSIVHLSGQTSRLKRFYLPGITLFDAESALLSKG